MADQLIPFDFHGDQLLLVDVDGAPQIVLKPAIEAIGLDYWTQIEKLRARSWAVTGQSPATGTDGKTYQMLTCTVRTFLMLLATIDERRVAKDVRPKLVAYQAEVADAIESYWTKGGVLNPRASADQLADLRGQAEVLTALHGIVDAKWLEAKARHVAARALGEEPEIDPAARPLTVGEYLEEKGVKNKALRSMSPKFGTKIKALYVALHGEKPSPVPRFVDGAIRDVAGYTEADRPLFDRVWREMAAVTT